MLERHDSPHILAGTQGSLRVSFYVDGVLTSAAGNVQLTTTRLDGTVLVDDEPASLVSTGIYEHVLTPAQTASLDLLTCSWSGSIDGAAQAVTTYAEIVGAYLFSIDQARSFDMGAMASEAAYPTAAIAAARDRITDEFEYICQYSFVPRINRDIVDGSGTEYLAVPALGLISVRSVEERTSGSTTWTAYDAEALADLYPYGDGRILRESLGVFTEGTRNMRVIYEYGYTVPPAEISRAGLLVLRDTLVASNLTDKAFQFSDETGTYRLAMPGRAYPYGIPSVDATLERYTAHALAIV